MVITGVTDADCARGKGKKKYSCDRFVPNQIIRGDQALPSGGDNREGESVNKRGTSYLGGWRWDGSSEARKRWNKVAGFLRTFEIGEATGGGRALRTVPIRCAT